MRILFLGPSFFGYQTEIASAFERAGHQVEFEDERPSNAAWARALLRSVPQLLRSQTERYYQQILSRVLTSNFDGVLVIKGEVVPRWFLEELRREQPNTKIIYYTFDSLENSARGMMLSNCFDGMYTFDERDAKSARELQYKPLFFVPEYSPQAEMRDIDLSFVGTLHGDRFKLTQAVAACLPDGISQFHYFMPASWYFWVRKLGSREQMRGVRRTDISTVPLSHEDVAALMRRSRATVDIQRVGQTGFTMRTFEALASGTAIISTNEALLHADFFDPEKILVIPREVGRIDKDEVREFVSSQPRCGHAPQAFDKYSVDVWVDEFVQAFRSEGEFPCA